MPYEWFTFFRALHVLFVVFWLGGVFFVTLVLLPALKPYNNEVRATWFKTLENRFACIARFSVVMVLLTGLLLLHAVGFWQNPVSKQWFALYCMMALWSLFAFVLFIAEPFLLPRLLPRIVRRYPDFVFPYRWICVMHYVLSVLSILVVVISILHAHGIFILPNLQ